MLDDRINNLFSSVRKTKQVAESLLGFRSRTGGREQDLLPAIALAVQRFREFQSLHQEVDSLRDALETRKLVERAKGILMRRLNLTEEEAFRRMQRRSQNENKKLGEIANAIITADGML